MSLESLLRVGVPALTSKVAAPPRSPHGIRLDKGEFPYPPAPEVIAAIHQAASGINRYPDVLTPSLRQALATYNQVSVDCIAVGNGSDDLIESVLKLSINPGDRVVVPVPSFFVYGAATQMLGGEVVSIPRQDDFDLDVPALIAAIDDRTKVLFIANPNNPTANATARERLMALLENVRCWVVVDECYFEIYGQTVADLIDRYPHLIVLRSLSKSFGLAGLRVGYSIANAQVTNYLYRVAQIFPVDGLAVAAGIAAVQAVDYARDRLRSIVQGREWLALALGELGLGVYPSQTNFLFVSTLGRMEATELVQLLAERGIYVADFAHKPGLDGYHWRVAVGTPNENQQLVDQLRQLW